MIALDTNILARLVINDDPLQAKQAAALIDGGSALFVSVTVMLELEWVLRGAYQLERAAILKTFEYLVSIRTISFERPSCLEQALHYYALGFDFADALHHAAIAHCDGFATFDKKLVKLAARAKLIPKVIIPG